MKARLLLLASACCALAACAGPAASFESHGKLSSAGAIEVRNVTGDVNAYAPKVGQPHDEYTVEGFGKPGTVFRRRGEAVSVAPDPGTPGEIRYLVRGPNGVTLDLSTKRGNINVADVTGVVTARTGVGDIKMLVPGYANAHAGKGNVTVYFGSTGWPGTLFFSSQDGTVELWVNATAKTDVHLHTDHGTIYIDFPLHGPDDLRGSASGFSETMNGAINGGAKRSIDVEVGNGSIRVLQLKPQV